MRNVQKLLFTESSPNIGGQELQLLAQLEGLQAQGLATLLACRPGSRIAAIASERKLEHVCLPFRNSLHLPSIFGMRRVMQQFQPDAVIAHSGHDANTVALAARLVKPRPLLVRARTYQPGVPRAWTYMHLFDKTLVPSEYLKSLLLRNPKIDTARISVLYPGIDFCANDTSSLASLPPELQQRLANLPSRVLLHAAMLRAEKGHQLILSILPELVKLYPDVCYVIAGEGELMDDLRSEVATRGLTNNVCFAGMVTALPALLQRAELLVMPSSYEPLGMSQIEALGLGTPVIASRTGGIPETVSHGDTGLLAAPSNAEEWLTQLTWALANPSAMREMAARGQKSVRDQFSMEGNLRHLLRHLENTSD